MLRGDLFLFESAYSADIFRRKIGSPRGLVRVVHNGVSRAEFEPIVASARRHRSGVHGRVAAGQGHRRADRRHRAACTRDGRTVTATWSATVPTASAAGPGRRATALRGAVHFMPAMPARQALDARPHHGGAVAGGIAALCGAGGGRRRQAADHHQGRRHPGNLRPAIQHPGTARTMPRRWPRRSPRRSTTRTPRRRSRASCASGCRRHFRSTPWLTACSPPTRRRSKRLAKAGRR